MPCQNPAYGVSSASGKGSEAGRFVTRIGEPWSHVLFLSPRFESTVESPESQRTSFSMSAAENLSDSMMRFMQERQGVQPWTGSEAAEIRIGRNAEDRFQVIIHRGSNGWFDVECPDRSYLSIRPPWSESPADPTPPPRTLDELRDGAKAVSQAYRMLNDAVERLHDGHFAADRAALNCFAETTLLRTRAMYEFLFQQKKAWVSAADYIGERLPAPTGKTLQMISDRVIHISYEGVSSRHEYSWEPRSLLNMIVQGVESFLGRLDAESPEHASWFRPTHDYVLSRNVFLIPQSRLEFYMVTTAGGIEAFHQMWDSNQFHALGRNYYDRDVPPF